MPKTQDIPAIDPLVKTGRRINPTIDGPRNQTVCFMLSEGEKLTLDRLAFCKQSTRSAVVANITAEFIAAAADSKQAKAAEVKLLAYLKECRNAVKERGELAIQSVPASGEK